MLEAVHAQDGNWGNIDAEAEIVRVGQSFGLDKDQSLRLFKQVVDEGYVYLGRILQVPGSEGRGSQPVGFGKINVTVSEGMELTDRGRALIGV